MPLFFPTPRPVERLEGQAGFRPLRAWCADAGVRCKASGAWTERPVRVRFGSGEAEIVYEASPRTGVEIRLPLAERHPLTEARYIVAALAYALMDGVARESLRGVAWARPGAKRGRPQLGTARNGRERQRQLRARRAIAKD